jgi:hypothetical protein
VILFREALQHVSAPPLPRSTRPPNQPCEEEDRDADSRRDRHRNATGQPDCEEDEPRDQARPPRMTEHVPRQIRRIVLALGGLFASELASLHGERILPALERSRGQTYGRRPLMVAGAA